MLILTAIIEGLIDIIVPIGICVILPIILYRMKTRKDSDEANRRADIIMAAIEKDPDINVDEYLKQMAPPQPSYEEKFREKLHRELLWGTILLVAGISIITLIISRAISQGEWREDYSSALGYLSIPLLAIGFGLLVAYHSGKKTLNEKAQTKGAEEE